MTSAKAICLTDSSPASRCWRTCLRVDDRDDGVEPEGRPHLVVGEEGLRDGSGIGQAGRLDQDAVEPVLALEQPAEDPDEVAAHGAADAAVVHLEELLLAGDHELVVDPDLAELVLDDGQLPAVLLGEDAVEEGRLAGAEEAGEDGDGRDHGMEAKPEFRAAQVTR